MRMRPKINESPAASRKRSIPNESPLRNWTTQKVTVSVPESGPTDETHEEDHVRRDDDRDEEGGEQHERKLEQRRHRDGIGEADTPRRRHDHQDVSETKRVPRRAEPTE